MFKYGSNDDDKKIAIISNSAFKIIFDSIWQGCLDSINQIQNAQIAESMYIEDLPVEFEIMKKYLEACKSGFSYWEDFFWNELSENNRKKCVVNLAAPFSIHQETVDVLVGT